MNDRHWIFSRLPSWLRWIIAVPASIVIGFITHYTINIVFAIFNPAHSRFWVELIYNIILFSVVFYSFFLCLPKWKLLITGIVALLFSIYLAIGLVIQAIDGTFMPESFTVVIADVFLAIFAIMALINGKENEKRNG